LPAASSKSSRDAVFARYAATTDSYSTRPNPLPMTLSYAAALPTPMPEYHVEGGKRSALTTLEAFSHSFAYTPRLRAPDPTPVAMATPMLHPSIDYHVIQLVLIALDSREGCSLLVADGFTDYAAVHWHSTSLTPISSSARMMRRVILSPFFTMICPSSSRMILVQTLLMASLMFIFQPPQGAQEP
jgi:hypothetical protein